jgi:hypothetical protein
MFCKDTVDFVPNHVCILGSGVADKVKAYLRKGYCGSVDLSKCQWSLGLNSVIWKSRTAAKKIPR